MVRALTIPAFLMPDEPVTVRTAGAGPAAPALAATDKHARPSTQTGASQRRKDQGRSPQKCYSGFTFFWKYKFRQKILLSEVEICRQKILISFLECTVIPNSYRMIKDRLAADLLTRSHDCD